MKDVLVKVHEKMKDQLTEKDHEKLPSGTGIRWQNRAQWQRMRLIEKGYLKKDSERGIWEITDEGRKYFENLKKEETEFSLKRYTESLKKTKS